MSHESVSQSDSQSLHASHLSIISSISQVLACPYLPLLRPSESLLSCWTSICTSMVCCNAMIRFYYHYYYCCCCWCRPAVILVNIVRRFECKKVAGDKFLNLHVDLRFFFFRSRERVISKIATSNDYKSGREPRNY